MIHIKENGVLKTVEFLYIKDPQSNNYKALKTLKKLENGQLVDLIYARPMVLGRGKLGEATL